jgi:hypothetical protein
MHGCPMDLHVSWFTVSMRHGQVTLLILQEGDPAGDLLVLMALGVVSFLDVSFCKQHSSLFDSICCVHLLPWH